MYASGGVAGVGLGGGIVLGELATRWHNKFDAPNSDIDTRLDAQQFGPQEAHAAATAMFAVAIARRRVHRLLVLVQVSRQADLRTLAQDDSAATSAPKIVLAPWVQPDVGGLAAIGQF